jgi:hypothetical protein
MSVNPDADAAVREVAVIPVAIDFRVEGPALFARERIERDDLPVRCADIEESTQVDRSGLKTGCPAPSRDGRQGLTGAICPGRLKVGDVAGSDFLERGVLRVLGEAGANGYQKGRQQSDRHVSILLPQQALENSLGTSGIIGGRKGPQPACRARGHCMQESPNIYS